MLHEAQLGCGFAALRLCLGVLALTPLFGMIENVMNTMGGVGVFGLISICLFFAFFIGMLVWTFCLKKPYLKSMRELPLDGEPAPEPGVEPTPNPDNRHDRT